MKSREGGGREGGGGGGGEGGLIKRRFVPYNFVCQGDSLFPAGGMGPLFNLIRICDEWEKGYCDIRGLCAEDDGVLQLILWKLIARNRRFSDGSKVKFYDVMRNLH